MFTRRSNRMYMLIILRSALSSRVFIYIHAHEPATTSLVEATAGLRHREVLAQAEAHVEATHTAKTEEFMEVLRVREGIESQRARDAIMFNEHEINHFGFQFRENIKHEAQEHVRFREIQTNEEIQAYQRVIDANHRQSLSSKEREIVDLKRRAGEERRVQNDRIAQLEHMVQFQTQHNLKRQGMIDSQLAQACPPPIVETATATLPAQTFASSTFASQADYVAPTSKAACCTAADNPSDEVLDEGNDEVEITYLDPRFSTGPVNIKREPSTAESSESRRPPGGVAAPVFRSNDARANTRDASPAPTQQYSPTDLGFGFSGDGYDHGDEGDDHGDDEKPGGGSDGNGGGRGDPRNPPNNPIGERIRRTPKKRRAKSPKGVPVFRMGVTIEMFRTLKIRRRMVKYLGESFESKSDEKPQAKEADTIKIPALPLAESYRNWRIKTREAVVAASTDPDNTFKWVSESWKEERTPEALRKVAPFATRYAKLLLPLPTSSQVTITLVPISDMGLRTLSNICSACSCVGKT